MPGTRKPGKERTKKIVKKKTAAPRESERATRNVLEFIPLGMHQYRLEPDGRLIFIEANPAAERILGLDHRVFIGKTIDEAFPSLKDTEVPQRYREVALTGKPWRTESIEYRDNVIQGAFEVHAFQTAPNTMVAAFEDITLRKRAELALTQSEEKYRRLYNETPVLLHSIDREVRIVDVNDYWLKIMGYERNEVLGRNVTDFYTEASRTYAREVIQPAFFRDGMVKDVSYQFIKKNGEVLDVLLSATAERDSAGNVVRSQAVIEDITDRKRTEEALRESEERFRAITMTASDAILLMDDKGKILYWNPAAERIFGYTNAEAVGKDLHMFLAPPRLHGNYQKGFARFVQTGQGPVVNRSVEMIAKKKDGTEVSIEVSTSAMNLGGKWHALGIVRDITERKQLEEERLKSQKLESIGMLAGGIAHDFNNLLQGVFGYISMAKVACGQKEKSLAMLEQAEKALHQSVHLTTQLLTFAKGGKPVKKLIDLAPMIEDSIKFALSGSRSSYRIDIDPLLWQVNADTGQLGQVIQNIVLNADQAMPLGGEITITARNEPEGAASLPSTLARGNYISVQIEDHGIGIPEQYLDKIFDPYFTTKEKGSGLGLATSYAIIKNHDGQISITSTVGKGTVFSIFLPAVTGRANSVTVEQAGLSGRSSCRVLVMDDEELIRSLAIELLHELGHEVEVAEHGEAALTAYKKAAAAGRPFDIVILDLTIRGGMGGAETVRLLCEIDPEVKAVVSSGYSEDAVIADHLAHGFKAFLKKPYNIDELQGVLNALLSEKTAEPQKAQNPQNKS